MSGARAARPLHSRRATTGRRAPPRCIFHRARAHFRCTLAYLPLYIRRSPPSQADVAAVRPAIAVGRQPLSVRQRSENQLFQSQEAQGVPGLCSIEAACAPSDSWHGAIPALHPARSQYFFLFFSPYTTVYDQSFFLRLGCCYGSRRESALPSSNPESVMQWLAYMTLTSENVEKSS